jgi:hypothetical protein
MSNLSFTNEIIFYDATGTDGVSGTIQGNSATGTTKILFNAEDRGEDTATITTSAVHNGVNHELFLEAGYDGATFALIDTDRFSTQFAFNSAGNTQTATASGFISVSPTLRRLYALGYV